MVECQFGDTVFYIAVGVGGGAILLLLIVTIILAVWGSNRGDKIRKLQQENRRQAQALQAKENAVHQNGQIVDHQINPQFVVTPSVPLSVVYRQNEIPPTARAQPEVNNYQQQAPGVIPANAINNYVSDNQEDRPHKPARESRKPRPLADESGLPRLRPDETWSIEEGVDRKNSRKPGRDDRYAEEMAPYGRKSDHRRNFDADETSSVILPRVVPQHKPEIKRNNSFGDMRPIRETEIDRASPPNQPKPYSYLNGGAYPSSGAARKNFDFDDKPGRKLNEELSNEEFNKRRSFIADRAGRGPRSVSPTNDPRRYPAGQGGFNRADPNRRSTSTSPNTRYIYPT